MADPDSEQLHTQEPVADLAGVFEADAARMRVDEQVEEISRAARITALGTLAFVAWVHAVDMPAKHQAAPKVTSISQQNYRNCEIVPETILKKVDEGLSKLGAGIEANRGVPDLGPSWHAVNPVGSSPFKLDFVGPSRERYVYLDELQPLIDRQAAAKEGVHLHDATPFLRNLPDPYNQPDGNVYYYPKIAEGPYMSAPFSVYEQRAHDYLAEFGIDFRLGTPKDGMTDNIVPADIKTLNSSADKAAMVNVIEVFSHIPQEYISLSGLKTFLVGVHGKSPKGKHAIKDSAAAYAFGSAQGNFIVSDIAYIDSHVIGHEMMHDLEGKTCLGNPSQDPQYAAYNKFSQHVPYKGKDAKVSYEQYAARTFTLNGKEQMSLDSYKQFLERNFSRPILIDRAHKNFQVACSLQNSLRTYIAGHAPDFESGYAGTSIIEDKAETADVIINPGTFAEHLDSTAPAIKQKFELILARIYRAVPGLEKYFVETSGPDFNITKTALQQDCNQPVKSSKVVHPPF